MTIHEQIIRIIHLPRDFNHPDNDQSAYHLLKSTGYFSSFDQISISDIQIEIKSRPEVIEEWIQWSEDKRTTAGWYLSNDHENPRVGYFSESKESDHQISYSDLTEACATFIKKEIEVIRAL